MKPGILSLLLIFFLLGGCTRKIDRESVTPPPDLIPKDQMVDIFADLKLFDAIIAAKQKKKDKNFEIDSVKYYLHNSILEKHNITRERFERSFEYYQSDMDMLDEIYEDAITRLSKLKSETEKE